MILKTIRRILSGHSPEQARVIEALDVFGRAVPTTSVYAVTARDEAMREAKRVIAQSDQPKKLLKEMGWAPLDAAALIILLYCRTELHSGRYHIYRGVLSDRGKGYRIVFDTALKRLTTSGRYDDVRAGEEREALAEAIAEAG